MNRRMVGGLLIIASVAVALTGFWLLLPISAPAEATEFVSIGGHSLKVTDALLVFFTFILSAATFMLWLSTNALVSGAEQTAERQLRAYVSVSSSTATPIGDDRRFSVRVEIKNFGQTPAYDVLFEAAYPVQPYPLPAQFAQPSSKSSIGMLGPTTALAVSFDGLATDDTVRDEYRSGARALFAVGIITYKDIFGKSRRTTFRMLRRSADPGNAISFDTEGNEGN